MQMNFMKSQMERLMRIVEYSSSRDRGKTAPEARINIKLVPLAEKDDNRGLSPHIRKNNGGAQDL